MSKKKFIVLDVEGMSVARPYNIGWIVADNTGKIYETFSCALPVAFWENLQNCLHAQTMTHNNIQEILQDFEMPEESKKYQYCKINDVFKKLLSTITEWRIKEIWAYNCPFDKSSLKRLFKEDFKILDNLVTFYDIIPAILHTRLLSNKYIAFCNKNGFITQKGNVQTRAEVVYKYLKNDLNFEEEHTGLSDCYCELEILCCAMKSGKKFKYKNSTPAWIELKQFCEVQNLETIIPPIEEIDNI